MGRQLRDGYTTGTCASAAAKAAALFLLEGTQPEQVTVPLSGGGMAVLDVEAVEPSELSSWIGEISEQTLWWKVRKDAGDDPDVTNGVWVYACVRPIRDQRWQYLCREGKGYYLEEFPGLYLNGGPGIGIATRPGLSCPVGHYAINPAPRQAILSVVEEVRRKSGWEGHLEICVAIPDGIRLAADTFNPRLGIEGGISVLGTTGIVRPMSEEAMKETVRLEIHMKAVAGRRVLLLTPGNYGEAFLREKLGISLGEAARCGNFVAAAAEMALEEGFDRLLLVGHMGKLVKVSAGMPHTHSRYGDHRMEQMEILTRQVLDDSVPGVGNALNEAASEFGRPREGSGDPNGSEDSGFVKESKTRLLRRIREANTTEEAVEYLLEADLATKVLNQMAVRVKERLEEWTGGRVQAEVVVFSQTHGVIGKTEGTEDFLSMVLADSLDSIDR